MSLSISFTCRYQHIFIRTHKNDGTRKCYDYSSYALWRYNAERATSPFSSFEWTIQDVTTYAISTTKIMRISILLENSTEYSCIHVSLKRKTTFFRYKREKELKLIQSKSSKDAKLCAIYRWITVSIELVFPSSSKKCAPILIKRTQQIYLNRSCDLEFSIKSL